MAKLDRIANRYAKAAFDYLVEGGKLSDVVTELQGFAALLETSPDLLQALTNRAISTEKRIQVLNDLVGKLSLSETTTRLLSVLAESGRLNHVAAVADRLHLLKLESQSVVHLDIQAPVELSDAEKKKVETKFSQILGKKVEASYALEPHLLGGLRVSAAGRDYNGTLSGWLGALEEKLIGGRI